MLRSCYALTENKETNAGQQKSKKNRLPSKSTVLRIGALSLLTKKISLRGWNSHLLVMENMFASHGHTAVHWGAFVLSTECCTLMSNTAHVNSVLGTLLWDILVSEMASHAYHFELD